MTRRASSGSFARGARLAAAAVLLLPMVAAAQLGNQFGSGASPDAGRGRLRDRAQPAAKAKLDEAVTKFQDEDLPTKLEGIQMLGTVEDRSKALGYLLQAANDPNAAIRLKAIDVLGAMEAKEAIPQLVQQLFMRDTDKATKQHVLVALGKIGDPKATKPILDFLARPGDDGMDGNAIYALGEIGDKSALPALERIAKGDDAALRPIAQNAVSRIKQKPEPDVVPPALAADLRRAGGEGGQPSNP
jgi:HEAT repeat protein